MKSTETTNSNAALMLEAAAMGPRLTQMEVFMNSRFLTNTVLSVLGGFTVVASLAWAPTTFMWLMLGAGIVAVALAGGLAIKGRGTAQRSLDGAIGTLGVWTIVASLVFGGSVVTWLGFASAIAFAGLALIGLALHELYTERVVHSFEVRSTPVEDRDFASING